MTIRYALIPAPCHYKIRTRTEYFGICPFFLVFISLWLFEFRSTQSKMSLVSLSMIHILVHMWRKKQKGTHLPNLILSTTLLSHTCYFSFDITLSAPSRLLLMSHWVKMKNIALIIRARAVCDPKQQHWKVCNPHSYIKGS